MAPRVSLGRRTENWMLLPCDMLGKSECASREEDDGGSVSSFLTCNRLKLRPGKAELLLYRGRFPWSFNSLPNSMFDCELLEKRYEQLRFKMRHKRNVDIARRRFLFRQ